MTTSSQQPLCFDPNQGGRFGELQLYSAKVIVAPCKGIRFPESRKVLLVCVIWNPAGKLFSWNSGSWALEYGTDSSRNLIYYLESGIHGMELSKNPRLS